MVMYMIRHGGLMRCCLESLDEVMMKSDTDPVEGDTLQCAYHDGEGMIFYRGAWQWNHPPLSEDL